MTDRELMQQALEALEWVEPSGLTGAGGVEARKKAIAALEKRLAQPEQRPVPPPWWPAVENILTEYGLQAIDFVADFKKALAQPEQEPVARAWDEGYRQGVEDECISEANIGIAGFGAKVKPARQNPYKTTTPQRTWVDLTDEEIEACRQKGYVNGGLNAPFDFDKAAGALLALSKEKNT